MANAPKFIRWQSPQAWTGIPAHRLMPKIFRHHRGGAAQEGERACQHALVANRHQLRDRVRSVASEDGDRVAIGGPAQLSVLLARRLLAQARAVLVALGQRAGWVTEPSLSTALRRALRQRCAQE